MKNINKQDTHLIKPNIKADAQFYFLGFIIYSTSYVVPLLLNLLIKINELENINTCENTSEYYTPTSILFGYLDFTLFLTALVGSLLLSRIGSKKGNFSLISIVLIITLFAISNLSPWTESLYVSSRNRELYSLAKRIEKNQTIQLPVVMKLEKTEINSFIENRDFNIFSLKILNKSSGFISENLPLKTIKISRGIFDSLIKNSEILSDRNYLMVISISNRNLFFLKDSNGNIVDHNLRSIKSDSN
jgi:hypothetical protein